MGRGTMLEIALVRFFKQEGNETHGGTIPSRLYLSFPTRSVPGFVLPFSNPLAPTQRMGASSN